MKQGSQFYLALETVRREDRKRFKAAVRLGASAYVREVHLRRVLPERPDLFEGHEPQARLADILAALRHALKGMIRARRQGSWHYSQARHLGLLQAFCGELVYTATAAPSGIDGSTAPVATPLDIEIPEGMA